MTQISLELIPENLKSLEEKLKIVKDKFHQISLVNIPDLPKYPLKSWEACNFTQNYFPRTIPHIRARDFTEQTSRILINNLNKNNISEILVVTGDMKNKDINGNLNSIKLINILSKSSPHIKIFAAIDQYRNKNNEIEKELNYAHKKVEAGAVGFFSQPFFSIEDMLNYSKILGTKNNFFGLSPVLSERSKSYWEKINKINFPRNFQANKEWNYSFGKEFISEITRIKSNAYLMPITANLNEYLSKIL